MSPVDDEKALAEAAARHDRVAAWEAAARLTSKFSDHSKSIEDHTVFQSVWKAAKIRWFDIAEILAGAAAARPDASPANRRLHSQMLMERGFTEEALARLHSVIEISNLSEFDRGQAFGHIGRIHKDRFVTAADAGDEPGARTSLRRALDAYQEGREKVPSQSVWLGINAAALLSRPEAAAIDRDARVKARQIAREITAEVDTQKAAARAAQTEPDLYADGTLAEACLALDDYATALQLVSVYVFNPQVNVFALNNFHRQLKQIWRIDQRPAPGAAILALVSAALLQRPDASLDVPRGDLPRAHSMEYQAVFGADRFDSLENYRRGLERASCVARIGRTSDNGVGTGFLLPGRLLSPKLDDRFVLMTNAHVINEADAEREKGALHPSEAVVTFADLEGVAPGREFRVAKVLYSSARTELDAVVAELSEPIAPTLSYPVAEVLPVATSKAPVRIIGHPSGRGLSFSVNELVDHDVPKLHYRTASEGGSSGSPVFNQQWMLMGLHHAGGDAVPRLRGQPGTYQANEGIWIKSICEALHKFLA